MKEKTSDGEIYTGKQFPDEPIMTYHFDPHEKEWVVRVHHKKGVYSICGCPGELEAQTVASALQRVASSKANRPAERLFREFVR
jgi:hypothetical protein